MKLSLPWKFAFGVYVTVPSAAKLTVPLVPCVTAVSSGLPSKVSALAPFVPVSTFAVTAVSSAVTSASGITSATAPTVTATVAVLVPPWPSRTV